MTKYKYPQGAIKSLDEVEAAIANKTVLYAVVEDTKASMIANLTPFIPRFFKKTAGDYILHFLHFDERDSDREVSISLEWRGIVPGKGTIGGHLFTNYWHAYAYSLKINGDKS